MNASLQHNNISEQKLMDEFGLSKNEIALIQKILNRKPTLLEYGIFSVMWSEHCSYKSTKKLLKNLPSSGECVIQGPGENAGIIALDDELAVAFKVESHNHPSMVMPYQGAATGVGGILRDIFTMGARPIALLNSLHFGDPDLDESNKAKIISTLTGVVSGIADYGNCVGIPTVGGEVHFHPSYSGNCLVNVMAVGIVNRNNIMRAVTETPGNIVLYYGNPTGRDGIHGATFASTQLTENLDRRPNVQVGDPFMEKRIMEATLEIIHNNLAEAVQDMGAAGLTCSSCEMPSRGNTGIEIDISKIPLRTNNLTPYEIMLSESQERMLAVVKPENVESIKNILDKWNIHYAEIGRITDDGNIRIYSTIADKSADYSQLQNSYIADIPLIKLTNELPERNLNSSKPDYADKCKINYEEIPEPEDLTDTLLQLLSSPQLSSRQWIGEQFDYMVGNSTIYKTIGGSAAVLSVEGTKKGIAVTLDSNAKAASINPRIGAMLSVAEAARNIVCSGAKPAGVTNNLNFGAPENPEIFWQISESISGMSEACRAFNTPITGGNVSLYNETKSSDKISNAIMPTLVIGMLGIINDSEKALSKAPLKNAEQKLFLLGDAVPALDCSEYLYKIHGQIKGQPAPPDFSKELAIHKFMQNAVSQNFITAANDVSSGGIASAAAEMAIAGSVGINLKLPYNIRPDIALFGETPGLVLFTAESKNVNALIKSADELNISITQIGHIIEKLFIIENLISIPVSIMKKRWGSFFSNLTGVNKNEK